MQSDVFTELLIEIRIIKFWETIKESFVTKDEFPFSMDLMNHMVIIATL